MRIVPFADSATIQLRRCWTRRALLTDWLPGDLAEALWQQPERLLAEATVLQHRGVRRTVRITAAGRPFVLKHYVEPTWRHGLKQFVTRSGDLEHHASVGRFGRAHAATRRVY